MDDAVRIEDLAAVDDDRRHEFVLSPSVGLSDLPEVRVTAEIARGVIHGTPFPRAVLGPAIPGEGPFRVLDESGEMLAVYRAEGRHAVPEVVMS